MFILFLFFCCNVLSSTYRWLQVSKLLFIFVDGLVSLDELDENPYKRFRLEDDFPGPLSGIQVIGLFVVLDKDYHSISTFNNSKHLFLKMNDVNDLLPRLSASQPPLSTIKKTSSASGSTAESSIPDKDLFGGFSQPAQVRHLIYFQPEVVIRFQCNKLFCFFSFQTFSALLRVLKALKQLRVARDRNSRDW